MRGGSKVLANAQLWRQPVRSDGEVTWAAVHAVALLHLKKYRLRSNNSEGATDIRLGGTVNNSPLLLGRLDYIRFLKSLAIVP